MKKIISTFLLVIVFTFTAFAGDSPGGDFAGDSPGGDIVDTCQKQCLNDQKDKQDYLFEIWKIFRVSFF